jgi:hypothetical protein
MYIIDQRFMGLNKIIIFFKNIIKSLEMEKNQQLTKKGGSKYSIEALRKDFQLE